MTTLSTSPYFSHSSVISTSSSSSTSSGPTMFLRITILESALRFINFCIKSIRCSLPLTISSLCCSRVVMASSVVLDSPSSLR
ncbi:hypothetical protein BpHYR1_033389 [Brachionus plicatilis]|uniref:Uncharacterized protein n=1 Tax=Brachionus plicatilis TaxID=10195 RepID=A0A3M7P9E2_BRAPC|nr:hypothetical protein BpHYR1_033389 [Brachionus plicatilis]